MKLLRKKNLRQLIVLNPADSIEPAEDDSSFFDSDDNSDDDSSLFDDLF